MNKEKEHITYPDVIRVVGCIIVTLYHFAFTLSQYGVQVPSPEKLYSWNGFSLVAPVVKCFIMISGALLYMRYKDAEFCCRTYYKNRFMGIYPMFWLAYLIAFTIMFIRGKGLVTSLFSAPKWTFLFTILGTDGYIISMPGFVDSNYYILGEWFLGVIIFCYAIFPAIRFLANKCKYIAPIISLTLLILLIQWKPYETNEDVSLVVNVFYFILGIFIWQMQQTIIEKKDRVPALKAVKPVLFFISLVLCVCCFFGYTPYKVMPRAYALILVTVSLYFVLMGVGDFIDALSKWSFFSAFRDFLRFLAKYTFPFYLVHHVFIYYYVSAFTATYQTYTTTLVMILILFLLVFLLAVLLQKLTDVIVEKWVKISRDKNKATETIGK
ncbi:MAG: acyltransferase [Lachnospiraceae bacterium]